MGDGSRRNEHVRATTARSKTCRGQWVYGSVPIETAKGGVSVRALRGRFQVFSMLFVCFEQSVRCFKKSVSRRVDSTENAHVRSEQEQTVSSEVELSKIHKEREREHRRQDVPVSSEVELRSDTGTNMHQIASAARVTCVTP